MTVQEYTVSRGPRAVRENITAHTTQQTKHILMILPAEGQSMFWRNIFPPPSGPKNNNIS
jgi:hypothetical protein